MLAALVARFHQPGENELDRYASWTAALEKLRDDWSTGTRPKAGEIGRYLSEVPDEQCADALQDLISEHLRLAWQDGIGVRLEFYPLEAPPAELIEDEFLARYEIPHGDAPSLDEYRVRFASRSDVTMLLARRFLDHGRYVKLRKLGLGILGEVWEAHDSHLKRRVAIKQLRRHLAGSTEARRLLAGEASTTARLEHPGIVSIHDFRDGADPFCVMRLVEGPTLSERLADYHHPPLTRTRSEHRLLCQELLLSFAAICDAVAYAHSHGVLHRDLKPANIIAGERGATAVLDWGSDSVVGTPDYMAPEQADGIADARTDVFGLGSILYETLTGRSPHGWAEGSRPHNWRELVRAACFESPRCIDPNVPRELEAICLRALHRDPAQRYQTAAEVSLEVKRYLAGEPVNAWREPLHRRLFRRLARGRA